MLERTEERRIGAKPLRRSNQIISENKQQLPIRYEICSQLTDEQAKDKILEYFDINKGLPKFGNNIMSDNGNYETYLYNENSEVAAGHFTQVGRYNNTIKFLFEDPAPISFFITLVDNSISGVKIKAKKGKLQNMDSNSTSFLKRCVSFQKKHNLSDDDINRVALLYLQSLIDNEVFKTQNPGLATNIEQMIAEYNNGGKKFVITVINGMVTMADIERNENPFGEPIVSVQMQQRVGGTRSKYKSRKTNKRRKPKSRKTRKSRNRR